MLNLNLKALTMENKNKTRGKFPFDSKSIVTYGAVMLHEALKQIAGKPTPIDVRRTAQNVRNTIKLVNKRRQSPAPS